MRRAVVLRRVALRNYRDLVRLFTIRYRQRSFGLRDVVVGFLRPGVQLVRERVCTRADYRLASRHGIRRAFAGRKAVSAYRHFVVRQRLAVVFLRIRLARQRYVALRDRQRAKVLFNCVVALFRRSFPCQGIGVRAASHIRLGSSRLERRGLTVHKAAYAAFGSQRRSVVGLACRQRCHRHFRRRNLDIRLLYTAFLSVIGHAHVYGICNYDIVPIPAYVRVRRQLPRPFCVLAVGGSILDGVAGNCPVDGHAMRLGIVVAFVGCYREACEVALEVRNVCTLRPDHAVVVVFLSRRQTGFSAPIPIIFLQRPARERIARVSRCHRALRHSCCWPYAFTF